ncbi:branched-chain amino acid ABC transporter permease [Azorhizobium sp. AG788]|uniref:branched-chain amino acid ABC transporter permease n=1 Tax=Azorhizobium sp. AG788 TaxID=2183897 RepID=UPI003138806B
MTSSLSITSPDTKPRQGRRNWRAALPYAAVAGVVGYAAFAGGYPATVVSFALIYAVFVIGLNLFMGFANQVSFGQNAFAAIGGYTSAVLTATYAWEPLPAMAVGMALAIAAACAIGYPTLRLKGHYLAMGTLAIGLIVYEITVEWQSVTQGYMGLSGIPPMGALGYEITSDRGQLLMLAGVVAGATFLSARLRTSRMGRALSAVAGSEEAARALGIPVARYKLLAFILSAALASLSGTLFVHVVGFVSPEVFGLHMVILTFTMLYVGGIGTIAGPVVGALIISLLPETFRGFKDYQDLAYGAALIVMLIYAPKGLSSLFAARGDK